MATYNSKAISSYHQVALTRPETTKARLAQDGDAPCNF
jgi:hypothetical protein